VKLIKAIKEIRQEKKTLRKARINQILNANPATKEDNISGKSKRVRAAEKDTSSKPSGSVSKCSGSNPIYSIKPNEWCLIEHAWKNKSGLCERLERRPKPLSYQACKGGAKMSVSNFRIKTPCKCGKKVKSDLPDDYWACKVVYTWDCVAKTKSSAIGKSK
jgi:hypothetical protein